MEVWFWESLLMFQSGETGPDVIILVFLFDKLIQTSALKLCFQEQGCPRFRRFFTDQLIGQFCFSLWAGVFQSKHFALQYFQICVKHCYMFCATSLESTGKSLHLLSHCTSFMGWLRRLTSELVSCVGVGLPVSGCSDAGSGLFGISSLSAHVARDSESGLWTDELSIGGSV